MAETNFTRGPWRWKVNPKYKTVELIGHKNDAVFRAARWGPKGAQIHFCSKHLFESIRKFMRPITGREHHADWIQTIDHPDAHLIAAAPEVYEALARCETLLSGIEFLDEPEVERDLMPAIRAALAKARGED